MLAEVGKATGLVAGDIPTATDGCGVVTFALPLVRMARAYSVFHELEGAAAVVRAMARHPDLVRGPGAADTVLMQTHAGWFAKGGAEGLFCAGSPDGVGVALKVEDGASVRSALPSERSSGGSVSTPERSGRRRSRARAARSSASCERRAEAR